MLASSDANPNPDATPKARRRAWMRVAQVLTPNEYEKLNRTIDVA